MPSIGPAEIVLLLLVALLLFGPKKLPDIARSIGEGMREFKDSVTENINGERPSTNEAPVELPSPAPEPDDSEARAVGAESRAEG
jgi:sec-independent protein translocase protein TatA